MDIERQLATLRITPEMLRLIGEIIDFQNGDGCLSRVLTTLLPLRSGYAYVSYSSLESVIEASKEGYDLSLRRTQASLGAGEPD